MNLHQQISGEQPAFTRFSSRQIGTQAVNADSEPGTVRQGEVLSKQAAEHATEDIAHATAAHAGIAMRASFQLNPSILALRIGDRLEHFQIEDVQLNYHQVQTWQAGFHYSLRHWMGLNQRNYRDYDALQTEVERLQFLENLLRANLLSFATGIGWYAEQPVEVRITKFKGEKWLPYKGAKVLCFSLNFVSNVSLPDYVGLGKGVSVGFGSVLRIGKSEIGNWNQDEGRQKPEADGPGWRPGVGRKSTETTKDENNREKDREDQADTPLSAKPRSTRSKDQSNHTI